MDLELILSQGKHYGTMSLEKSAFCSKDGLVPLRFDSSFRKNLGRTFVAQKIQSVKLISLFFFVVQRRS